MDRKSESARGNIMKILLNNHELLKSSENQSFVVEVYKLFIHIFEKYVPKIPEKPEKPQIVILRTLLEATRYSVSYNSETNLLPDRFTLVEHNQAIESGPEIPDDLSEESLMYHARSIANELRVRVFIILSDYPSQILATPLPDNYKSLNVRC